MNDELTTRELGAWLRDHEKDRRKVADELKSLISRYLGKGQDSEVALDLISTVLDWFVPTYPNKERRERLLGATLNIAVNQAERRASLVKRLGAVPELLDAFGCSKVPPSFVKLMAEWLAEEPGLECWQEDLDGLAEKLNRRVSGELILAELIYEADAEVSALGFKVNNDTAKIDEVTRIRKILVRDVQKLKKRKGQD